MINVKPYLYLEAYVTMLFWMGYTRLIYLLYTAHLELIIFDSKNNIQEFISVYSDTLKWINESIIQLCVNFFW